MSLWVETLIRDSILYMFLDTYVCLQLIHIYVLGYFICLIESTCLCVKIMFLIFSVKQFSEKILQWLPELLYILYNINSTIQKSRFKESYLDVDCLLTFKLCFMQTSLKIRFKESMCNKYIILSIIAEKKIKSYYTL